MVERRIELDRRYHRKKKIKKLKSKLGTVTGEAREKLLYKIKRLSPWWTEASIKQSEAALSGQVGATAAPKEEKERKKTAPAARKKA